MTDTTNELDGYVGDCSLCGEPIMEGDDYGETFHGYAHTGCIIDQRGDDDSID